MSRRIAVTLAVGFAIVLALGCNEAKAPANKQVVILHGQPDPWSLHVSRTGLGGAPDRVAWKNEDDVAHTLAFPKSPFGTAELRFTIPANSTSRTFVVGSGVARGIYLYEVNPTFQPATPDSGPGPVVIVDE